MAGRGGWKWGVGVERDARGGWWWRGGGGQVDRRWRWRTQWGALGSTWASLDPSSQRGAALRPQRGLVKSRHCLWFIASAAAWGPLLWSADLHKHVCVCACVMGVGRGDSREKRTALQYIHLWTLVSALHCPPPGPQPSDEGADEGKRLIAGVSIKKFGICFFFFFKKKLRLNSSFSRDGWFKSARVFLSWIA